MSTNRRYLSVLAASVAVALGTLSSASAAPLPFTINPNSLTGVGGSTFVATDINGTSNALIQQTGASTQLETGVVQFQQFTNGGVTVPNGTSALVPTGNIGAGPSTYNLYAQF